MCVNKRALKESHEGLLEETHKLGIVRLSPCQCTRPQTAAARTQLPGGRERPEDHGAGPGAQGA